MRAERFPFQPEIAAQLRIVRKRKEFVFFFERHCLRPKHPTMTVDEVKLALTVLDLRERLIFKLGVFAGLRPGEIFAFRRTGLTENAAGFLEKDRKPFDDIVANFARGRSDRCSSLCSTPPRSHARTSPSSLLVHKTRRRLGAPNSSRRRGRRPCRST
jgi:hypothetical protein